MRRRATRFADMVAVGPSLHQEHEYAHALAKAIGWSAVYDQVDAVDEDDPAGVLALQAAVLAVAEPLARGLHQHREAIRCVSSVALTMDIAHVYARLGSAFGELRDFRQAVAMHEEAHRLMQYIPLVRGPSDAAHELSEVRGFHEHRHVKVNSDLAFAYEAVNDDESALRSHKTALGLCSKRIDHGYWLACLFGLSTCCAAHGDTAQALTLNKRALRLCRDDPEEHMHALTKLGCLALQTRDYGRAYTLFAQKREIARELEKCCAVVQCDSRMADCMWVEARGASDPRERERCMQEAGELLAPCPALTCFNSDHRLQCQILLRLACQRYDTGDVAAALGHLEALVRAVRTEADTTVGCADCSHCQTAAAPLLACGQCRVVRFCDAACQRRASATRSMTTQRHVIPHRRLCPLLRALRLARPAAKIRALMLAFLEEARRSPAYTL